MLIILQTKKRTSPIWVCGPQQKTTTINDYIPYNSRVELAQINL